MAANMNKSIDSGAAPGPIRAACAAPPGEPARPRLCSRGSAWPAAAPRTAPGCPARNRGHRGSRWAHASTLTCTPGTQCAASSPMCGRDAGLPGANTRGCPCPTRSASRPTGQGHTPQPVKRLPQVRQGGRAPLVRAPRRDPGARGCARAEKTLNFCNCQDSYEVNTPSGTILGTDGNCVQDDASRPPWCYVVKESCAVAPPTRNGSAWDYCRGARPQGMVMGLGAHRVQQWIAHALNRLHTHTQCACLRRRVRISRPHRAIWRAPLPSLRAAYADLGVSGAGRRAIYG